MDRETTHSLTPAEAKDRLRAAAQQLSFANWMVERRWTILTVALAGGFIIGRLGLPIAARAILLRQVAPLLLTTMWQRRKRRPETIRVGKSQEPQSQKPS